MAIRHWNNEKIKKENALINIVVGEKGNGKSYQTKIKEGVQHYLDTGKRFILIRRYKEEVTTEKVEKYFDDVDIKGLTNGKYDSIVVYRRQLFFAQYDVLKCNYHKGEKIGYAFALSQEQSYSSVSFLDVDTIIFEEFMSRTTYLINEPTKLMTFYSTVDRKRGVVKMWLLGNTITRLCPYLYAWNLEAIFKDLKQGQLTTREYLLEDGQILKMAIEYCEKTGTTSFAIGNGATMINQGGWMSEPQPHLPYSSKSIDIIFRFVIRMKSNTFLVSVFVTDSFKFFVVPKVTSVKPRTFVLTDEIQDNKYYFTDIRNLPKYMKNLEKIFDDFTSRNIYYCTDLCGTEFKLAINFSIDI